MTTPKKKDHEYGIGETSDGDINIFPPSELPAQLERIRVLEEAAEGKVDSTGIEEGAREEVDADAEPDISDLNDYDDLLDEPPEA